MHGGEQSTREMGKQAQPHEGRVAMSMLRGLSSFLEMASRWASLTNLTNLGHMWRVVLMALFLFVSS